ncbi:ParA family protein [Listeria booriae]|uniref:ParA family protein n=1 Tax=Listeria booriae TaxID=1552123 RepID=A0A7X0XBD3_9LIST|nr:ParA family protein [Listeria booriae]MBC1490991.1 ParA family protein [Listeria booriae]MBC1491094.1 ParA family protein [Listeria booriae]MBC2258849.1 ParA family protein [Listeria booriae]
MVDIEPILRRYDNILSGSSLDNPLSNGKDFKTYAVSNFRGGIGKTTLSLNIAYKFAKDYRSLFLDMCPQRNFSELLLRDDLLNANPTIHDALMNKIMGPAWGLENDPISRRVRDTNSIFDSDTKISHIIPGSDQLFLFPNNLYTQLNQYYSLSSDSGKNKNGISTILQSLNDIISEETQDLKSEKVLMDTSPFFGGGTHLAWMAADALIIPVRVDEQSLLALELTLSMLSDDNKDYNIWRNRAGIIKKTKVQAIAITHCGWNRQSKHQIDSTSKVFIEKALEIAEKYKSVFSTDEPIDHFAVLSDFQGSGKISGKFGIPMEKLEKKSYTIDGKRLKVNNSVDRYKKEIDYLYDLIN